jgi:hypothetical protein
VAENDSDMATQVARKILFIDVAPQKHNEYDDQPSLIASYQSLKRSFRAG